MKRIPLFALATALSTGTAVAQEAAYPPGTGPTILIAYGRFLGGGQ